VTTRFSAIAILFFESTLLVLEKVIEFTNELKEP